MSPSYADIDKLVEDNYFHWEFNMRMKLSRKGFIAHLVKPEFDHHSDRSTLEWKTNDMKTVGVIAGDVGITCQVYMRGAQTAAEACHQEAAQLQDESWHTFFVEYDDKFKELVMKMEAIGEPLDETRQIVLMLGSLTDEYWLVCSVLENTPNVVL